MRWSSDCLTTGAPPPFLSMCLPALGFGETTWEILVIRESKSRKNNMMNPTYVYRSCVFWSHPEVKPLLPGASHSCPAWAWLPPIAPSPAHSYLAQHLPIASLALLPERCTASPPSGFALLFSVMFEDTWWIMYLFMMLEHKVCEALGLSFCSVLRMQAALDEYLFSDRVNRFYRTLV